MNLNEILEQRIDPDKVDATLSSLKVNPPDDFRSFYRQYQGPFPSENTGFMLLDICIDEGGESIMLSTDACRTEHGFPEKYLVISSLLEGVLVYDTIKGFIYDVDFEGSDQALIAEKLQPEYQSFTEFLEWFLG